MNAPLLLMYNLNGDNGSRLRLLCAQMHIRIRNVSAEEFGQPVGALAGFCAPVPNAESAGFDDEMLVLVNFDGNLLNRLLQQMRAAHIPPIVLKAVLTPTNMNWSSDRLHKEISSEHEAMLQQRRAHSDNNPRP